MGTQLSDHEKSAPKGAPAGVQAEARSRAYALLARLAGGGLTSEREREWAAADAGLASAIAAYGDDLDALAADHQHVFGFSCPPFESALLDPEGHLGNETSDRVQRTLAAAGIAEGPGGEAPDHLAAQLYALALLAGAEADADRDGELAIAERMRAQSRHLLDQHLLRWLPTFASAVRRAGRPWPVALVHTIEEVALQHRGALGSADEADLSFELPPLALSLEEGSTGLADIARVLATPARAGVLISRDDIARLGRKTDTPRGFGDRATLIENLLRAGAQLESIDEILGSLLDLLREAKAELGEDRLSDVPSSLRLPWQARIDETCALVATISAASRNVD